MEDFNKDQAIVIRIVKYFLMALLISASLGAGLFLFPYLLPFFVGMLIAEAAIYLERLFFGWRQGDKSLSRVLVNKGRIRRQSLIYFLLIILILALAIGGMSQGISSLSRLARTLPDFFINSRIDQKIIDQLHQWNRESFDFEAAELIRNLWGRLVNQVPSFAGQLLGIGSAFFASLPMMTFVVMIVIMSGYYYISESARFYRKGLRLFGNRSFVRRSFLVINGMTTTMFKVSGGYLLILVCTFIEAFIGLSLIRMPHAGLWAFICAVVDLLPILGITATLIPIALYFVVLQLYWQALAVLGLLLVMSILRRFLEPLILGNAMSLHPLLTIVSMALGIVVYGLKGVLLGPVFCMTLREILRVFALSESLRRGFAKLLAGRSGPAWIRPPKA